MYTLKIRFFVIDKYCFTEYNEKKFFENFYSNKILEAKLLPTFIVYLLIDTKAERKHVQNHQASCTLSVCSEYCSWQKIKAMGTFFSLSSYLLILFIFFFLSI